MKLIIAGTRDIVDYEEVKKGIALFRERYPNFIITEIVSGRARGVDKLGEDWANEMDFQLNLLRLIGRILTCQTHVFKRIDLVLCTMQMQGKTVIC